MAVLTAGCGSKQTYDHYNVEPDLYESAKIAAKIWNQQGAHIEISDEKPYNMVVNRSLVEKGECGEFNPNNGRIEIGCVELVGSIAHELGHAIGLEHVNSGIMALHAEDREDLSEEDLEECRREGVCN